MCQRWRERQRGRDTDTDGNRDRERKVPDMLWGLRATREQTITALSLSSIYLFLLVSLAQHRGIRLLINASPQRHNAVKKQNSYMVTEIDIRLSLLLSLEFTRTIYS